MECSCEQLYEDFIDSVLEYVAEKSLLLKLCMHGIDQDDDKFDVLHVVVCRSRLAELFEYLTTNGYFICKHCSREYKVMELDDVIHGMSAFALLYNPI